MPSYTLKYFNVRGAAEASRLLFAVAGVEYKDVRYSREDWPKYKEGTIMKALPVLEIDGKQVCQSQAIARYLAREFKLYGKTNADALRIDEAHEAMIDLMQTAVKIRFGKDEEKPTHTKTVKEEALPKLVNFIEKRLCENNGGKDFYVGKTITLADLVLYNGLFMLRTLLGADDFGAVIKGHDTIRDYWKRIDADPKVAAWVKKRPETEF